MSQHDAFVQRQIAKNARSVELPIRGVISSVAPDIESVNVDMAQTPGTPRLVVRHPYFGVNSWIRTMPEPGTAVLTQRRGDLHRAEIWGYISNTLPPQVKDSKSQQSLIRRLEAGEIEIRSKGRAYAFFGRRGDLELRGGPLEMDMSPGRLEITSIAPTHKRRLMLHDPTILAHEERFGIVRRPSQKNPQLAPAVQDFIRIQTAGEFAQEYFRSINRQDGKQLSVVQDGDVVGPDGTFETLAATNKRLRFKRTFVDVSGSNLLTLSIDEGLNFLLNNSAATSTEGNLQFGANNTLKLNTKTLKITATDTGQFTFNTGLTIRSNQVSVASSNVTSGNTGAFQAVLGTTLVNGVLNPIFTALASALSVLAAEPALTPATAATMTSLSTMLSTLSGNLSSVLSQQVKLSG